MKHVAALVEMVAIALWAMSASAGVVITQQTSIETNREVPGQGHEVTEEETVMIQGNKEKLIVQRPINKKLTLTRITVTDLDKGKVYMTDPMSKTYLEADLPPHGEGAKEEYLARYRASINLKKTGKSRVVKGFRCEEFASQGTVTFSSYTLNECIAKDAPGGAEFTAFRKRMLTELKVLPRTGTIPEGVPVDTQTMTEPRKPSPSEMGQQVSPEFKMRMANQPTFVTHSMVTQIEVKNLPPDTFEVPAGYTKKELTEKRPSGPPAPPAAGSPAPATAGSAAPPTSH